MTASLHLALNVSDLDESMEFYRAAFDVAPDKVAQGYARFTLGTPPVVLTLNERSSVRRGRRLDHLGVRLGTQAEFVTVRERLRRTGRVHKEQQQTKCCHAIQDKVWLVDPDGNHWEFYVVTEDLTPPERDRAASGKKSCCEEI